MKDIVIRINKIMSFLRNESKMQSWYYVLAAIFVVGLVFQDVSKFPMTAALSLSSFFVLISGNWMEKWKRIKAKKVILFLLGYYLLHAFGLFYSEDGSYGGRVISLKISLLLFGVVWTVVKLSKEQRRKVLIAFVLATFAASFIDLLLASMRYLESGNAMEFLYHNLSVVFPNKKHYLSIYYTLSIFIAAYFLIRSSKLKAKLVNLLVIFWFMGMVVLLGARAQLLAIVLVGTILCFAELKKRVRGWKIWGYTTALFAVLVTVIALNPVTRPKVVESLDEIQQFVAPVGGKNTNPRAYIWDYGVQQIQSQSLLLGAGTGDAVHELQERMKECDIQFWIGDGHYLLRDKNLNYHNQFMESLATLGILALILLLLILILPLFQLKKQNAVFWMFLILMLISFQTESVLERQAGVLFFAFFYPFLHGEKLD